MFRIIQMFQSKPNLIWLLLRIPVVLISLSFHEMSHAYAAYKMGDETAKNLGRLTMNPIKHLDPIGSVCLILFGMGWAKPVPIMTRNFKKPKLGMALTALAGPVSNLMLSVAGFFLCSLFAKIFGYDNVENILTNGYGNMAAFIFCLMLYIFHITNLVLAIFNMIPIPPLDGSRLAFIFLPDKIYFGMMKYERIIMIVFLAVMFFVGFSWLSDLCYLISDGMFALISFIPGFSNFKNVPDVLMYLLSNI